MSKVLWEWISNNGVETCSVVTPVGNKIQTVNYKFIYSARNAHLKQDTGNEVEIHSV